MSEDRLITVAIHTYDRAVALKSLLEAEGVTAVLHNVNLTTPVVSSGVRVRIRENDLPLALRIIENAEIFREIPDAGDNDRRTVIVPIDFTDYSMRALAMAFDIAHTHKADILLLHSFINPQITERVQLTDAPTFDPAEVREAERTLLEAARLGMKRVESKIKTAIKNGDFPAVKFRSEITEGLPEEVICETAKKASPQLIVMATREAGRKVEELIGSVTAEVLDSCRQPVLTIPESVKLDRLSDISEIIFFCNLDQEDILAMATLSRLLDGISPRVTMVHIPGKKDRPSADNKALQQLADYCREHYPRFDIHVRSVDPASLQAECAKLVKEIPVNLIAMPNKKRNVFVRFFNPSLAHRLLLQADLPMLVIPV